MHRANQKIKNNEDGFAAIVIALTLILVLSLVTLGFAELMNNNQKLATQKQLSNQAYYAAETGVNDAVKAIATATSPVTKTACGTKTGDPNFGPGTNEVGGTSAIYSCLLINPYPSSLAYGNIEVNAPRVIEMEGTDTSGNPLPVNTIDFSWVGSSGQDAFLPTTNSCTTLPSAANWSSSSQANTGILKVTIIPLTTGNISVLTRSDLINNEFIAYLCPTTADSPGTFGSDGYNNGPGLNSGEATGDIVNGNCNTGNNGTPTDMPYSCNVQITGLNNAFNGASTYIVAVQSIYLDNSLNIFLDGGSSGTTQLNIGDAQTIIDSTGDSQGVFKRIEARIPDHNNYPYPPAGVEGLNGICKQLALIPPSSTTDYGVGDGCNEYNP